MLIKEGAESFLAILYSMARDMERLRLLSQSLVYAVLRCNFAPEKVLSARLSKCLFDCSLFFQKVELRELEFLSLTFRDYATFLLTHVHDRRSM